VETPRQKDQRYRLYTLLNVGRSKLGMQDEDYRALLARHGAKERDGQVSATTLDLLGLERVLEELKKKGFKPIAKNQTRRRRRVPSAGHATTEQIDLMKYIWSALGQADILRDKTERGLLAWVRVSTRRETGTSTGYEALEFLPTEIAQHLIERLKKWAARSDVELALHG